MDTMTALRTLVNTPNTFAEYSTAVASVQIYLGKQAGPRCFDVKADLPMGTYEGSHTPEGLFSILRKWGFHTVVDWEIKPTRNHV